jgi:hypothetical protein
MSERTKELAALDNENGAANLRYMQLLAQKSQLEEQIDQVNDQIIAARGALAAFQAVEKALTAAQQEDEADDG